MLNQVTRAIEPHLPLTEAITTWNAISEELAVPRLRLGQLESYFAENKLSPMGWRDDQMLLSLGYSFRAGGGHLNEVDALGADPVVGRGTGLRAVPDSRRLGEYLGRLLGAGSGPVPGSGQQAAEADRTVGRERCVPRTKWMQ